LKLHDKNIV